MAQMRLDLSTRMRDSMSDQPSSSPSRCPAPPPARLQRACVGFRAMAGRQQVDAGKFRKASATVTTSGGEGRTCAAILQPPGP